MTLVLIFAVVAVAWVAITGSLTLLNLLLGAAIGAAALYVLRHRIGTQVSFRRLRRIAALAGLFIYELFASAIRVGILVLRPNLRRELQPVIIAFPLSVTSDAEITLLANLITLTPGTLSVDVSADRKSLYVHAVTCPDPDALIRDIANGFERKVREIFS